MNIELLFCVVSVGILSGRSAAEQLAESEVDDLMRKERTLKHMINLSFTAALTLGASITAMAGEIHGNVDQIQEDSVSGWAWDADAPEETPAVSVTVADSTGTVVQEASGIADIQRDDVAACGFGSGLCGFSIPIDWSALPDGTYTVRTSVDGQPVGGDRPYYKGAAPIRSLGIFKTTGYCQCRSCSSGWGSLTSTGTIASANHTIAVDPRVIPYGTKVMINGTVYTAEDKGSGVRGNHIDIFFNTHSEARNQGVQYAEVFLVGA